MPKHTHNNEINWQDKSDNICCTIRLTNSTPYKWNAQVQTMKTSQTVQTVADPADIKAFIIHFRYECVWTLGHVANITTTPQNSWPNLPKVKKCLFKCLLYWVNRNKNKMSKTLQLTHFNKVTQTVWILKNPWNCLLLLSCWANGYTTHSWTKWDIFTADI